MIVIWYILQNECNADVKHIEIIRQGVKSNGIETKPNE